MKISKLLLLSRNDIPFEQAQLLIHQPTIKEISLIGEEYFYAGCEFLTFSKNKILGKDKNNLEDFSDFEILMTIMRDTNPQVQQQKVIMELVLSLLFPEYHITFLPMSILLSKKGQDGNQERHFIEKTNFNRFKQIITKMFCLDNILGQTGAYNPSGPQAQAIINKIRQGQRKRMKLKGKQNHEISILYQYISIMSIALKVDINVFFNYTIYQLFDSFKRYRLNDEYNVYLSAKMAGAQGMKEPKNWMGDLNSQDD